jgi:hypothetical protein
MNFDVEYYEYDCGWPCTVNGCPGHITDIPVSIIIDGIRFEVEGAEGGDFPGSDIEKVKQVKAVVSELYEAVKAFKKNKKNESKSMLA